MRVGVVGAGLAGLAAARTFEAHGHEPVIFESQDFLGGRVLTTSLGPFVFDPGATTISPMGKTIEQVLLHEISTEHLVRVAKPIAAHDGVRAVSGGLMAANTPRYCYSNGIAELPKLLAAPLDVRLNTVVRAITAGNKGTYSVNGEEFDAVVLTAPTPECVDVLSTISEPRKFSNVRFRSCLTIMLGFEATYEANFHALVGPDQAHPLSWLSVESLKCPGTRAPEGQTAVVAQMSAEYSRRRFEAQDELILEETLGDVSRLMGKAFTSPVVWQVMRFKYSHPETTTSFEAVNSPLSRLVIAGDALLGGRTELAYESGIKAAKMILEN